MSLNNLYVAIVLMITGLGSFTPQIAIAATNAQAVAAIIDAENLYYEGQFEKSLKAILELQKNPKVRSDPELQVWVHDIAIDNLIHA